MLTNINDLIIKFRRKSQFKEVITKLYSLKFPLFLLAGD